MRLSAKIAAIEFAGDEVRLALVRTGGSRPTVLALHRQRAVYAQPEERHAAMVEAVRALSTHVRKASSCVLCTDSRHAVARVLRLSFRGARRVAAAVPFELEPYLAVPLEDLVVDFTTIREIDGETEVLAVGIPRETLKVQLNILREAGLDPEGIGLDAAGLTAAWLALQKRATGLRAVLHVRPETAILAVLYGRSLAYLRTLPFGAARFAANIPDTARQVENCLRAFSASWKGDETIGELAVTGMTDHAEAQFPFEEALSIPVSFEDVLSQFRGAGPALAALAAEQAASTPLSTEEAEDVPSTRIPDGEGAIWEAAIGVAFGNAGGPCVFEFMDKEFATATAGKGLARRILFSSALAVFVLLLGGAYLFEDHAKKQQELEGIGQQIWQIYSETIPEKEGVRSLKDRPRPDIGGARTAEAFKNDLLKLPVGQGLSDPELFEKASLLEVLAELGQVMPEGKISLTELRLTAGRDKRIVITGEIQDPAAFEEMMKKLGESKILHIDAEPTKSMQEGRQTFTLNAKR